MDFPKQFTDALARLDADIDNAERALADLRRKREGADAFLEYSGMSSAAGGARSVPRSAPATSGSSDGPTALVLAAVQGTHRDSYTLDSLMNEITAAGGQVTKDQVRNSVHYLVRQKKMTNIRRGLWATTNAETPVATGVSDSDRSTNDRSWKEGGIREDDTEPLRDNDHHPAPGDEDYYHDLRAAIEVASEV